MGEITQYLIWKLVIVAEIPRAAEISENLRYMSVIMHFIRGSI